MIENEALRQQRLAAQRKAMEAGGVELSMEELAARAMARLEGRPIAEREEVPAPITKPSTLGAYANANDALVSEETKEALDVAGRMTLAAGKAILSKSLEVAALAQAKGKEATILAQEKLRSAKDERDEKRIASNRASEARVAEKAQIPVEAKAELPVAAPIEQSPQSVEVAIPKAWKQAPEKRSRLPSILIGGLLLVLLVGGISWWVLGGDETPEPVAVVEPVPAAPEKMAPSIEPVAIEPAIEIQPALPPDSTEGIGAKPVQIPEASGPEPVQVPSVEQKPELPYVPKVIKAPKPIPVQSVAPKPAPVKKPVVPPAEKDQWQDKGIDQLDALEKQVGG